MEEEELGKTPRRLSEKTEKERIDDADEYAVEEMQRNVLDTLRGDRDIVDHLTDPRKPDCYGTERVVPKPGVFRTECVLCPWESLCRIKYKETVERKKAGED